MAGAKYLNSEILVANFNRFLLCMHINKSFQCAASNKKPEAFSKRCANLVNIKTFNYEQEAMYEMSWETLFPK